MPQKLSKHCGFYLRAEKDEAGMDVNKSAVLEDISCLVLRQRHSGFHIIVHVVIYLAVKPSGWR